MTGIEHWLLPKVGVSVPPWTINNTTPDHVKLRPAAEMPQIREKYSDKRSHF